MIDIMTYLPARRRSTASDWQSFNAVCCHHQGQTPDRRGRGGIKVSAQGWTYHCFNCGFTASFILGRNLSVKARKLLTWLNVPQEDIDRINLESLRHRSMHDILDHRQKTFNVLADIKFPEADLPAGAEFVTAQHQAQYAYLQRRCVPADYPYMTASVARVNARPGVIVPFTYDHTIVGYSTRFLDEGNPRYINSIPPGYVFGTDLQKPNWTRVIVCEGVFDALSISGLALMHNEISDAQARLIRSLGRDVIVVPDQDAAGLTLVDHAMKHNWTVSIPDWPPGVKDINDAVVKMGALATLITILRARETSRVKIELARRRLARRVGMK